MQKSNNGANSPEVIELVLTFMGTAPKDFLNSYMVNLCNYAEKKGVKSSDVKDLVQDTIVSFLSMIRQYQNNGKLIEKPDAYLFIILNNKVNRYFKSRKKAIPYSSPSDVEDSCPLLMEENLFIVNEQKKEKEKQIQELKFWIKQNLSESEQEIIQYRSQGLKYHEIEEILKIESSTLRKKVSRIKNKWKNKHST